MMKDKNIITLHLDIRKMAHCQCSQEQFIEFKQAILDPTVTKIQTKENTINWFGDSKEYWVDLHKIRYLCVWDIEKKDDNTFNHSISLLDYKILV